MLTTQQINKSKALYSATATKYDLFPKSFLDKYLDKIGQAPASTLLKLHNAFEGGLIDHMLTTAKYAKKINEALDESIQVNYESVLRVCLLAELGKIDLYTPCDSKWHRENMGKMYEFNESLVSMSVSERSVYIALSEGINLSEAECQAILNFDKPSDDKQSNWHTEVLGVILQQAIKLAIIEEKKRYELASE